MLLFIPFADMSLLCLVFTVKMENWDVAIQASEVKELAWRTSLMSRLARLMGRLFVYSGYLMVIFFLSNLYDIIFFLGETFYY